MFSQTIEYALRAILTIGQHDGTPCTAETISQIAEIPAPYLSKMMQGLVRAKLLSSKRGVKGGFVLIKNPAELTILDIIDAIEPIKRIRECPLKIGAHRGTLCPLHRRLDNAIAMVEESFRSTTVAELLAPAGSVTPLCDEKHVLAIDMSTVDKKKSRKPAAKRKRESHGANAKTANPK